MSEVVLEAIRDFKKDNKEEHRDIIKRFDLQNGRVRRLENWRAYIIGGMSAIAFGTGVAITILFKLIR